MKYILTTSVFGFPRYPDNLVPNASFGNRSTMRLNSRHWLNWILATFAFALALSGLNLGPSTARVAAAPVKIANATSETDACLITGQGDTAQDRRVAALVTELLRLSTDSDGKRFGGVLCKASGAAKQDLMVLLGDSHANHFTPGLARMAEEHGLRLLIIVRGACPAVALPVGLHPDCQRWQEEAFSLISEASPALVITGSSYSHPAPIDSWSAGFSRTMEMVLQGSNQMLDVRDVPRFADDVQECMERKANVTNRWQCGLPKSEAIPPNAVGIWDQLSALAQSNPRVNNMDLTDHICDANYCSPADPSGALRYSDSNHLIAEYSETLWPSFSSAVSRQLEMAPSTARKLKTKSKNERLKVTWKKPRKPGSSSKIKYHVKMKPTGSWNKKGAKTYKCKTKSLTCKSGNVPPGSKYTISVTPQNSAGKAPPTKTKHKRPAA